MVTSTNITTSFITVLFSGFILLFIYSILSHRLFVQHTLIRVQVHTSKYSYIDALIKKRYMSLPNQYQPPMKKQPQKPPMEKHPQQSSMEKPSMEKHPQQRLKETQPKSMKPTKKSIKKAIVNKPKPIVKVQKDPMYDSDIDIMKWQRPEFQAEFRNPCWYMTTDKPYKMTSCGHGVFSSMRARRFLKSPVLRCLPYFYVVGQPRSGLTNIYNRIIRHPDIIAPPHQDIFWLQRHRFRESCSSVNTYLDYFHGVSEKIKSYQVFNPKSNTSYHSKITGDCSGDIMWDNTKWRDLPGNQGCRGPCLTNADYIKHLNPDAKIIISLRNPLDRVYSDYLAQSVWLKYQPDNEQFNKLVVEQIYDINTCLKKNNTARYCLYDANIQSAQSKVRVGVGLYQVYLEDWFQVFSRKQIHIINFEYYVENIAREMPRLFRFLGLRTLNMEERMNVMEDVVINERTKVAEEADMWMETRETLQNFYQPFNVKLAQLLTDERYLWERNG